MTLYHNRTRALESSLPLSLRKRVRHYLRGLLKRSAAARFPRYAFWTKLPRSLFLKYCPNVRRPDQRFIRDVLWGQYCVFLAIRIYDDLFDGHVNQRSLLVVSERFKLEAERVFSYHFKSNSPFWNIYRKCFAQTTHAIVEVALLQQGTSTSAQRFLKRYAKVSAIFKIGSAAVCTRYKRLNDFATISEFSNELAMAGHILDDLEDVEEDLFQNRFNFVARVLLAHQNGKSTDPIFINIARNILYGDGLNRILHEVHFHLGRAARAIRPLHLSSVERYLRLQLRNLENFACGLQRLRAQVVLEKANNFEFRSLKKSTHQYAFRG